MVLRTCPGRQYEEKLTYYESSLYLDELNHRCCSCWLKLGVQGTVHFLHIADAVCNCDGNLPCRSALVSFCMAVSA